MKKKQDNSKEARLALDRESARAQREQIRARLALPMNKRTNFLRIRLLSGGSHL